MTLTPNPGDGRRRRRHANRPVQSPIEVFVRRLALAIVLVYLAIAVVVALTACEPIEPECTPSGEVTCAKRVGGPCFDSCGELLPDTTANRNPVR